MILTVDIGNTTIALTGLERVGGDYNIVFAEKMPSDKGRRDFHTPVERLLDGHFARIEGAALSSVVPELTEPVCRAVERVTGKAPVVISAKDCGSLTYGVNEPEKVGLDRIADSAWAAARYPLPAVTADFGTATTFNVIGVGGSGCTPDEGIVAPFVYIEDASDVGGVCLGGMIAAGMQTSLNALSERAAQLPRLGLSFPERLIGRNTEECMLSGAVIGAAAMTDGIAARAETELGAPVSLIITGGGAGLAEPFLAYPHIHEPYLLAKGLAYIYNEITR